MLSITSISNIVSIYFWYPAFDLGWYYIVHITESAVKVCSILAVTWFVGKYHIKKRMLHNKFLKNRSKVNWENYRKQRNHVNKVKR
jgi:hypothetical protein